MRVLILILIALLCLFLYIFIGFFVTKLWQKYVEEYEEGNPWELMVFLWPVSSLVLVFAIPFRICQRIFDMENKKAKKEKGGDKTLVDKTSMV